MNIEEFVEVWIKRSELNFVLGFAGQDIRPLIQFVIITRTLTNYLSSLRLNLDTLQSLYQVGVQVFVPLPPSTQSYFFRVSTRDRRTFHKYRSRFQEGHSSRYCHRILRKHFTKRRQELLTGSTLPSSRTSHQRPHLKAS
jgi:hypothetical protein